MITPDYVKAMAAYNQWQNRSIHKAAGNLTETQRRQDCGLFFGSVHKTLSHLMWGDTIWLWRFTGRPAPKGSNVTESVDEFAEWGDLVQARMALDTEIISWSEGVTDEFLASGMSYFSVAVNRQISKSNALLVTHFFNHQTHHRGQVHGVLTGMGQQPDDTDLPFMPEQ